MLPADPQDSIASTTVVETRPLLVCLKFPDARLGSPQSMGDTQPLRLRSPPCVVNHTDGGESELCLDALHYVCSHLRDPEFRSKLKEIEELRKELAAWKLGTPELVPGRYYSIESDTCMMHGWSFDEDMPFRYEGDVAEYRSCHWNNQEARQVWRTAKGPFRVFVSPIKHSDPDDERQFGHALGSPIRFYLKFSDCTSVCKWEEMHDECWDPEEAWALYSNFPTWMAQMELERSRDVAIGGSVHVAHVRLMGETLATAPPLSTTSRANSSRAAPTSSRRSVPTQSPPTAALWCQQSRARRPSWPGSR